jgi:hypothetical protein
MRMLLRLDEEREEEGREEEVKHVFLSPSTQLFSI